MPALRKVPVVFLNAFRFSGWRCGDRPIINSQFNFFCRGVVTSCPRRFGAVQLRRAGMSTLACTAASIAQRSSSQNCETVQEGRKKPKAWKKAGGKKYLKLKCLWQSLNYGERCSCLCNPVQSQGSTKSQASFPTPPSASARPDQFSQHLTKQIYPREEFFQHAGTKIWQRLWTALVIKTLWGLSFIGKIFQWFLVSYDFPMIPCSLFIDFLSCLWNDKP